MKKKKVLIFGAGINQLTLIQACNNLGYKSVVIDPNFNAPGKLIADKFVVVDPQDYIRTLEVAQSSNVDGIATSQMENPLRLMAKLAKELNVIFSTPESIEKGLNKFMMKKEFIKHNVPHAKGIHFTDKKELFSNRLNDFKFPLIIKPVDAHSSRGVYKVDSIDDINQYIDETMSFSKAGDFLIEEFVDGPEYSVESVTYRGKTTVIQYTEKIITPFPNVVELGHLQPAELSESEKHLIDQAVGSAIEAIGIDNTVSHTEVKLTKKGPVVIEIGPRMGGDFISSFLVLHSCGVNLDEATIQMSLGRHPDINPSKNQYSIIKYLELEPEKVVHRIGNWKQVLDLPGVVFADVNIREGEIIQRITDSAKRPGFVIVEGDSKNAINELSDTYLQQLKDVIMLV